jgi:type IV secretion system protein VirB10
MNTNSPPPPPPPPEDPYSSFSSGPDLGPGELPENLAQGRPSVAANPGRVLLVLGVVGLVLAILLYNVFYGKRDRNDEDKGPERTVAASQVAPPPLPMETPVFTPPPVPEPTKVGIIKPEDDSAARAQLRARLHSNMILSDNSASNNGGVSDLFGSNEIASEDPDLKFQSQIVKANSKAERVKATFIGNLHRTIAQGRLIQATLETAINTELPAPLRAIVSRDTFGEAGTEPLIPKGSRLIGQYSTDLAGGQSRVFVVWTRVIRPDGVDVMLGSPLVDQIGQAGIGGQVDNKFQQIFSRSIMASIISIGFAIGVESINPNDTGTSTTSSTFGTTQSGNAASSATVNALNRLGTTTETFLARFISAAPTILVDQGTPVNVFVNRDLVFPGDIAGPRMVN